MWLIIFIKNFSVNERSCVWNDPNTAAQNYSPYKETQVTLIVSLITIKERQCVFGFMTGSDFMDDFYCFFIIFFFC